MDAYRQLGEVKVEPCGACVHDPDHPEVRTGVIDLGSPMMMRCNVCGDRWIDPTIERRVKNALHMFDELTKSNEAMSDKLIEEMSRTRRNLKVQIVCAMIAGTVLADRLVRIFFP